MTSDCLGENRITSAPNRAISNRAHELSPLIRKVHDASDVHSPCQRPLPGRYSRRTDLWGRRREKVLDLLEVGQGGGVKVFLEVGPTPVLQEPPRSDSQKLRRRLPYVVNKESGWPEPGNDHLKPPASWTF